MTDLTNRVLIVDVSHIAHNFGNVPAKMSTMVSIGGRQISVNTTIQSGVIKNITRWSRRGFYPTAVCFDRPCLARTSYFKSIFDKLNEVIPDATPVAYKGGRSKSIPALIEALNMSENLLREGGVNCLSQHGYEADDLVSAAVDATKQFYPNHFIDIVTNDTDLIPLVDDQISVFLRSQKGTWAECKELEKNKYIQVTPANYSEVINGRSDYKNLYVPYNSILLIKLLRGDPSDNLPGLKKFYRPKQVEQLLLDIEQSGVDVSQAFKYGSQPQWDMFEETLRGRVPEEHLFLIKAFWVGMNLNQSFPNRPRAFLNKPFTPFNVQDLQRAVDCLRIHI